ncbi:MAG: methyltransferase domain-containing protein [Acidobacteria bacterium]|nr:methyltransferase domain-containing protein [Acidobacteriota bacterium]
MDPAILAQYPQLADEDAGLPHRMRAFYLPLLEDFCRRRGLRREDVRVLDAGCGNGMPAELLTCAGYSCYGIDLWSVRPHQWGDRDFPDGPRCLLADVTRMPFDDGSFDVLLSSGLLEHVGVEEEWTPHYSVRPSADQAQVRTAFLQECLRVLRRPGTLFLDFPNGLFPIDFWHDNQRTGMRWHSPFERFLPTASEIERLLERAGFEGSFEALSPARRFIFGQVGRRWWGRALTAPAYGFLRAMETPGLRWMARSALNPYLVLRAETR